MSQISRPFQIALVVVSVLGIAWFLLLRGHAPAPTTTAPTAPAPAVTPAALSNAASKAQAAVRASKAEAHKLAQAAAAGVRAAHSSGTTAHKPTPAAPASPAVQVAKELASGKVVVLLFWNPDSAADQQVVSQVDQVSKEFTDVDVHTALASQVTEYGTVTADLSVLDTPTIEVISPDGQAMILGAPTDTVILGETIAQARLNYGAPPVQSLSSDAPGTARARYITDANRVCQGVKVAVPKGSLALTQLLTASADLTAIAGLPVPAQDRAFLKFELDTAAGGVPYLHQAEDLPGDSPTAHSALFEWVADVDQASTALANYGLTGCFAWAADQPQR